MFGKPNSIVTRRNRAELTKKYRIRLYVFSILIAIVLLTLPFYNYVGDILFLYPNTSDIHANDIEIHTVDVGQGLCNLIRFPDGTTLIFDTGTSESWSKLDTYIEKVLLRKGDSVTYMVISHIDQDHIGSAKNVINKYSPKFVYIPDLSENEISSNANYLDFYDTLQKSDCKIRYNSAGKSLRIGEAYLTWLAPNREYYAYSNDYSAVILLKYNDFKILFTGDSGHNIGQDYRANVESEYMSYAEDNGIDMDIDILIAGHHGSKYSTGMELLTVTTPQVVIVPVGENTNGHPAQEFYDTIATYDVNNGTHLFDYILTTLDYGNIIVVIDTQSNYTIFNIDNIAKYIFVPYYVVVLIIIVPLGYFAIDSIIVYVNLTKTKKNSDNKEETKQP